MGGGGCSPKTCAATPTSRRKAPGCQALDLSSVGPPSPAIGSSGPRSTLPCYPGPGSSYLPTSCLPYRAPRVRASEFRSQPMGGRGPVDGDKSRPFSRIQQGGRGPRAPRAGRTVCGVYPASPCAASTPQTQQPCPVLPGQGAKVTSCRSGKDGTKPQGGRGLI